MVANLRDDGEWRDLFRSRSNEFRLIKQQLLFTARTWFTLPQGPSRQLEVTIKLTLEPSTPLLCHSMHRVIAQFRDEAPLAAARWRLPTPFGDRESAWREFQAARLPMQCSRDMAFKFLHVVLPTSERQYLFDILPSNVRCAVVVGPTNTMYSVVALWRDLCGLLFAACCTPYTDFQFPVNVTLWSAPFLCGSLSSSTWRDGRRRTPVRSLKRLRSRYERELWTTGTPFGVVICQL